MLNIDASYVHCTYFLKGNEVDHIEKIGDLVITSGKLCACDPCNLTDKNWNQEMLLTVPTGIYPVLVDSKEHLVNIMFNPRGDIFFWEDIKFKRKMYPDSIIVDSGEYGFIDKDGIKAIQSNTEKGIYPKEFRFDAPKSTKINSHGYDYCYEQEITNSKNNFLGISTLFGDDEYTVRAGYNESNKIECISGFLLGKNFGVGLYINSAKISRKTIEKFKKINS
ncbi:MAG TPA: hypothetical protein VIK14_13310 [Ignavibacteria bacterium]